MTRYVGYIAMSVDGFIADADGSVAWLDPFNEKLKDFTGYADFIADVDALIMGRPTYEQVMGWGWPYERRDGYVLTRQTDFSGEHVAAAGDIETIRVAIEKSGHEKVWIMGGGKTQRIARDAGMFDTLRVFVMPTLLGDGRALFAPGIQHNLNLISCQELAGGILQIDYEFEE